MNAILIIGLLAIFTVSVTVSSFCIILMLWGITEQLNNIAAELKVANNKQ